MHDKIEVTPYLSQKIKNISLLAIIMVFVQHGSYGLPNTGTHGVFKYLISLGIADYPVPFFFIVSGYFLSRRFTPTFDWFRTEIKKRTFSLLMPYLIYIGFGFWLFDCSSRITILDGLGITSLLPAVGPLWYIRTLILLCILSPIIIGTTTLMARHTVCRYFGLAIFIIASLIAFPAKKSLGMSTLYFSFGTFLAAYGCCLGKISTKIKFTVSLIMLVTLLSFKLHHILHHPCDTAEVFLRWQVVPFTIASIWYGYDLLFKNRVLHMPQLLRFAGETTFFVYCNESFLRWCLNSVVNKIGCQSFTNTPSYVIASAFLIAMLGLLLAKILKRYIPIFYKTLSGGR